MIPKYVAWEYWQHGESEIVPTRWIPGEAWALIKGEWRQVDSSEVGNEGCVLDEGIFNETFVKVLIPLPPTAFQSSGGVVSAPPNTKPTKAKYDLTGLTVLPNDGKGFVIGGVPSKPSK